VSVAGPISVAYLNDYVPAWADALVEAVAEIFSRPAVRLDIRLDLRAKLVQERGQYHATLMVAGVLRNRPPTSSKIIGITDVDLFVPVLTFVFGQSQLDGPAAVMSTYRLRNEFYGLPRDDGLLLERSVKEVVHELGHAFGLVHCADYGCVMRASTYVEDVDLKGAEFCPTCQGTLHRNSNRDVRNSTVS